MIKKLHLYLGFVCALIFLNLSISGIMISFFNDYSHLIDKVYYGQMRGEQKSLNTILTDLKKKNQNFALERIVFGDYYVGFGGYENDKSRSFYFYSKDGTFIGSNTASSKFLNFIYSLHFNLGLEIFGYEKIGEWIIALANLGILFFIFSGIYLYMPDLKRNFKKSMSLNFNFRGLAKLRSLHSIFGLYIASILLVISLTAIYYCFSYVMDFINKFESDLKFSQPEKDFIGIDFDKALSSFQNISNNSWLCIYDKDNYKIILGNFDYYNITRDEDKNFHMKESKYYLYDVIYNLHTGFFNRFTQIVWVICCIGFLVVVWLGIKMGFRKRKKLDTKFNNLSMIDFLRNLLNVTKFP
ncbi:PepSY-associated TM helix domain-containing protein [Campylobacter sp. RM15925]|uniref:PepSY-associated TM helix domain-containing protein n=1 Tax=Campylobacter sp. RM15925 TaxID=1705724 RepID=UPI00201D45EC|nr:PepSY-associated TM helix domain-containing protein [Campylobacter sp. RM15925]